MMHEVTSVPGCPYVHSNQLKFHSVAVSPLANERHFPASNTLHLICFLPLTTREAKLCLLPLKIMSSTTHHT